MPPSLSVSRTLSFCVIHNTILEYLDPKPTQWPDADFIVGNPPFLGNKRMRDVLGDGYAEALRKSYPDVPDSVDFVLYWWHKAAEVVRNGNTRRFGFITTNSITQTFNRRVIANHTGGKDPLKVLWAIPDHPWAEDGAAVRIAMTVGGLEGQAWLGRVVEETCPGIPEDETARIEGQSEEVINGDLTAGADVSITSSLGANYGLSSNGMALHGAGFLVTKSKWEKWGKPSIVNNFRNGRDLMDISRDVMVIDLFGLSERQVRDDFPLIYQHVLENVKPERDQNNRTHRKNNWWLFGDPNTRLRSALSGLKRYIVTPHVSKYRIFQFVDRNVISDHMVIAIALEDSSCLGILSSRIHMVWSLAVGGTLEDRPIYYKTRCFDPFPFPEASEAKKQTIRDLAERLDAHRKGAQSRGITITGMYNLLQKLRSGDPFTAQERSQHELAQTEILRQLHDELDRAVVEAYGWPADIQDAEILERLVALNRERAAEEARGLVRWLRPDFQCPQASQPEAQPIFDLETAPGEKPAVLAPAMAQPWPKDLKDQLAAIRGLLFSSDHLWTLEEVGAAFKSRGRYRESIQAHLGLLTDLGVLVVLESPNGLKFHRPHAMGA